MDIKPEFKGVPPKKNSLRAFLEAMKEIEEGHYSEDDCPLCRLIEDDDEVVEIEFDEYEDEQ
jgi:hypothetical protein